MGLLSLLFRSKISARPEDYPMVYLRWYPDGKEYGPLTFTDLLTRKWSGPPKLGRFENETRWRKYKHFLGIINGLVASKEQRAYLRKNEIPFDDATLSFKAANSIIQEHQEKERERRRIERAEKEKLPATKHTRKKMDNYGLSYPEDITRAEAKELIAQHEEELAFNDLVSELKSKGVRMSESLLGLASERDADGESTLYRELDALSDVLEQLEQLGVTGVLPIGETITELSATIKRYDDAIFEAESAESDLQEREILDKFDEYRIVGALSQKCMKEFKKTVAERSLAGSWSFEKHVVKLIKECFPNVKLKEI